MAENARGFAELENVGIASTREEFRQWLEENHSTERECWLRVKRGKPVEGTFAYLDAVEEARFSTATYAGHDLASLFGKQKKLKITKVIKNI